MASHFSYKTEENDLLSHSTKNQSMLGWHIFWKDDDDDDEEEDDVL